MTQVVGCDFFWSVKMGYTPPFTITSKAINLIAEISARLERFTIEQEKEEGLRLCKINRMKTIRGSLAIEGNSLSEEQVTALIDGKTVIAPLKKSGAIRRVGADKNGYWEVVK